MSLLLKSERLLLRPFEAGDRVAVLALLADPAFMAWSAKGPLHGAAAEARFEGLMENARATGFGKFAVLTKDDGALIGYCGIEPTVLLGAVERELGFRVAGTHRRRGYAGEAARLAIADYFARSDAGYLMAYVEPGNTPSLDLIKKLGFVFQRAIDHHDLDYRLYRIDRGSAA